MCVAVPARITWVGQAHPATIPGRVDVDGEAVEVDLIMVPQATVGDYVVTHAGYAVRLIAPQAAAETIELINRA